MKSEREKMRKSEETLAEHTLHTQQHQKPSQATGERKKEKESMREMMNSQQYRQKDDSDDAKTGCV